MTIQTFYVHVQTHKRTCIYCQSRACILWLVLYNKCFFAFLPISRLLIHSSLINISNQLDKIRQANKIIKQSLAIDQAAASTSQLLSNCPSSALHPSALAGLFVRRVLGPAVPRSIVSAPFDEEPS